MLYDVELSSVQSAVLMNERRKRGQVCGKMRRTYVYNRRDSRRSLAVI